MDHEKLLKLSNIHQVDERDEVMDKERQAKQKMKSELNQKDLNLENYEDDELPREKH